MPIWKKIFKFNDEKAKLLEKRIDDRYSLSPSYPLSVNLQKEGHQWETSVINVSVGGFRLKFLKEVPEPSFLSHKNQWIACVDLAGHSFKIAGNLIYTDISLQKSNFSVGFMIDPIGEKREELITSFYHSIFPVIIGDTLAEIPEIDVHQNNSQNKKRIFTGAEGCVMSLWYNSTDDINSTLPYEFEIMIEDLVIRGNKQHKLEFFMIPNEEKQYLHRSSPINCALQGNDIKWAAQFFQWILIHLKSDFPENIKNYLKEHC